MSASLSFLKIFCYIFFHMFSLVISDPLRLTHFDAFNKSLNREYPGGLFFFCENMMKNHYDDELMRYPRNLSVI